MDICKETSYKHLEDFIRRNLSSDRIIDEINMSIDTGQLEKSLVPFICKVSNNDSVKSLNTDTNSHFYDIDYDNRENEVVGITDDGDDFVTDKIVIDNKDFSCISLDSENHLNGSVENSLDTCKINGNYRKGGNVVVKNNLFTNSYYYSNNNSKFHVNSCKWSNHNSEPKSFSSSKPQVNFSTPKKDHSVLGKSRTVTFPIQENDDKFKSDKVMFKNSTKGHVLKENNHSSHCQSKQNVKQQRDCDNHKHISSNLCDRRMDFKSQRENSFVQGGVEVAKQNTQRRTSKSDDSDNDEELMKVPVALLQNDHNDSFESVSELASQHKSSKAHLVTCLSLDKIIEARRSQVEKNIILKNQELASENDIADEECRDTELLELMKQADDLDSSKVQRNRITDLPPGLEIFDMQRCYHYFCPLHGLSLRNCGFIGEQGTSFDKKLARLSSVTLKDMIAFGVIKVHLDSTLFKEALLKYLFRFLSLHNNETVTYACQDIFVWYIKSSINGKNRSFSWYPSTTEVVATILNYGINTTIGCPVSHILLSAEKTLMHSKDSCSCSKKDNPEFSVVMDGLNRIVEIFTLFLEQKHLHIYSQEEVCDFILLLCWLSLDIRLLGKLVKIKFERCIAAGLEIISASDWPDKMKYLAEQLAELGGHHRNVLYVTLGLPVSERGIHLQRAVSFLAVQYLLNVENPCFVADVTPFMLLEFLKLNPLHHVKDCFLLHSVVSLLDLCVGNKVLPLYRNALQEMCNIAMNTFGKIRETFQCLEETKVKDLLVRLYTKWNLLVQKLPYRKETIFRYSTPSEYDASIESHGDVCVSEIKELAVDET